MTYVDGERKMTEKERKEEIARLLSRLKELSATPRSDWHAGFEALLRIDMHKYADLVRIDTECEIGIFPPRTDFMIVVGDEKIVWDKAFFKSLVDAVSRTAQFYIAKYHIDAISTCFLYGSGARYRKMDKELARQLGTQVEILGSLNTVQGPKDFLLSDYVNACGALIRDN